MATDLEQRVRDAGTDYGMFERTAEAVRWLRESAPTPARVRVVGDDDSDGVTSAHILTTAFRRAGYDVAPAVQPIHTAADAAAALEPDADLYVLADAGSAYLPELDRKQRPVLILDHHTVRSHTPRHVFEVNPRRQGREHTWQVSASVVSALFAIALNNRNWDLAYAGIAGGISDRQHLRGWSGLIGYCVDGAVRFGNVAHSPGLVLTGTTMVESIMESLDPYFPSLAGDHEATERLLGEFGIAPGADPLKIPDATARALAARLTQALPPRGAERAYPLYGDRLALRHASEVPTVFHLSRALEAATAQGLHKTALMMLAGSADARQEIESVARARSRRILGEIRRLRERTQEAKRFRWVETDDGANTGVYSHTLLTYVFGDEKPMMVLARTGHVVKASARGSTRLFLDRGLDLSIALPAAAAHAGGHAGGHPGAAGATIPAERLPEFLRAVDEELARLERGPPA